MKTTLIMLPCWAALAPALMATPFDNDIPGEQSTYVSIRDANHYSILLDEKLLTYREYLKYHTRYVKNKNAERYIYTIGNIGANALNTILGTLSIKRQSDGKLMAEYDFSIALGWEKPYDPFTPGSDETMRGIDQRNIINPKYPHRKVILRPKGGEENIYWIIFYPQRIGKRIDNRGTDPQPGGNTMIIYCPKTGFIDFIGRDPNKTTRLNPADLAGKRQEHPLNG